MKGRFLASLFPLLLALIFLYSAWNAYAHNQCIGIGKYHVSNHVCYDSERFYEIVIALVVAFSFILQVFYIFIAKDSPMVGGYQNPYGKGPYIKNLLVFVMILFFIAFVAWIGYTTLKNNGLL